MAQVGTGLRLISRRADTLFICPEHAQLFAQARGAGRGAAGALPAGTPAVPTLMLNKEAKAFRTAHPELARLADPPDLPLPIVEDPGCFDIAVVGGAAGRGAYFYGAGEPVTMPVDE